MGSANFKLLDGGEIHNINVRKQNIGDNDGTKALAIDIKISGEAEGSLLADLFGCEASAVLPFWTVSTVNTPVFHGIEKIPCSTKLTGHDIKIASKTFKDIVLQKFFVKPIAGLNIEVQFQVTIANLAEHEIEKLLGHIKTVCAISVVGPKDLFNQKDEEKTEAPATPPAKKETKPAAKKETKPAAKKETKKPAAKKTPVVKKPTPKKTVKPEKDPQGKAPKKGSIDPSTINAAARGKTTLAAVK